MTGSSLHMSEDSKPQSEIPIYLVSSAYTLGDRRPISTLTEQIGEAAIDELMSEGIVSYCHSEESSSYLSARSIEETFALWKAQYDLSEIGMVLYCSESLEPGQGIGPELVAACASAGLEHVSIVGVSMNSCGNLAPAIRLARGLLRGGDCRAVAIVTADVSNGRSRLAYMNMGILSDGAASFVLTTLPATSGFCIHGFGHATNHKLLSFELERNKRSVLKNITVGVREAVVCLRKTGP